MNRQNSSPLAEASTKFNLEATRLQIDLPMLEVILQTKAEVEALSAQAGLQILHHFLEQEIEQRCGRRGKQRAYRHGSQPGYVVYGGRKVSIDKPRLRAKRGRELVLKSYQAFQQEGRMQRAVARTLTHQVSTRNYAAAIDGKWVPLNHGRIALQLEGAEIFYRRYICVESDEDHSSSKSLCSPCTINGQKADKRRSHRLVVLSFVCLISQTSAT